MEAKAMGRNRGGLAAGPALGGLVRGAFATSAGAVAVAVLAGWFAPGIAQTPPRAATLFADADLPLGERLIGEHRCAACHARKFGGDGASIYRPKGRISTPGYLRGMVEQCNSELNLGLFPEEVTAVAAVLNRDHYRFD
jgi:hypothetical protein